MKREDYSSTRAFALAIIEDTGTKTSLSTIRDRISKGWTDIGKLASPPATKAGAGRQGFKAANWTGKP